LSKKSEAVIKWRKRTKQKMVLAMGGKCQCCGYDKCYDALEFHHIDPSKKDFSFGGYRASPKNLSSLIEELKKCIMLCANCHREVHANVRDLPKEHSLLNEYFLRSENEIKKSEKPNTKKIRFRKILFTAKELDDMLHNEFDGNQSVLARHLNVTETAIRKHRKKYSLVMEQ